MTGIASLFSNSGTEDEGSHGALVSSAKVINIDDNDATMLGAKGSYIEFYYVAANTVFVRAVGITGQGTPNLDMSAGAAKFNHTTGIS